MISKNIKDLRQKNGMTQKELADLLHVTAQAVSRWENADVEPSVDTISNMAKIFGVTTDEIISGPDSKPQNNDSSDESAATVAPSKQMLALCEQCKRPIYNSNEIVTQHKSRGAIYHICSDCNKKNVEANERYRYDNGIKQRIKSFVWGTIAAILTLVLSLIYILSDTRETGEIVFFIILPIAAFTFTSCMFLKNNFLEDMFLAVAGWGFVKFPGLIFSLDLDGIIWLITVKIAFAVLGFLLGLLSVILALLLCLALSLFVYPFALSKNIKDPKTTDLY